MEIRLRLPAGHDTDCHPGLRETVHDTGLSLRAEKDCPPPTVIKIETNG